MEDLPEASAGRGRLFLVGGLALLALTLSLIAGVGVLTPQRAPADPRPPGPWPTLRPLHALDLIEGPVEGQVVEGQVIDANTKRPIAEASVHSLTGEARTDAEGRFTLPALVPPVIVKAPGYERRSLEIGPFPPTVALRSQVIKAAYLTYFGVGDKAIRSRVFQLLDRTELNGVVIDVKGDRGFIPYRTQVPLALEAGAQGPVIIKEFDQMLEGLKAKGVYTIARIVVFKDNVLAQHRRDWAVIDTRTGQPWLDKEGLAWLDPFVEEVWDYAISIAREAAQKGFDEIQFDYLRFPTDGRLRAARYSRPNTRQTRLPAIAAFLARARKELAPTGVFLAADLFGYTAFNENDTDIGQRVEEMAPYLDYLSPMVYPSGYHLGIPGYRNPVEHPYKVVFASIQHIRKRTQSLPVRIRPWIQDFRDYAFDRRPFGVEEIRAQARGAADAGAAGWMLWNPRNDYTAAALEPKAPVKEETPADQ